MGGRARILGVSLFFLAGNGLLSYTALAPEAKAWVFVLLLAVPFLFLFAGGKEGPPPSLGGEEERAPGPPSWVWWLLGSAAVLLRTYRLTDFHLWPTGDEALHGYLAIPLSQQWDWRFFYTVGEHPPLLIWCLGLFFGAFDSPFLDLWTLPAVLSILTVPVCYLAARSFLPRSTALLFLCLGAFSYWPLIFGRYCHQSVFIPLFELAGLWILGKCSKVREGAARDLGMFLLGLWMGLGSLTFTSWAVVLLGMTLTVLFRRSGVPAYLGGLVLGLFPFLAAAVREGYGHHLIDSSSASHWFTGAHQVVTHLSYITCLFWGSLQTGTSYGPQWGGMLNPVLSSCFFLGGAELLSYWKKPMAQWVMAALLLLFLPGLLSADYVEFNRVLQSMPLVLLISVIGMEKLMGLFPGRKRSVFLTLVLLSSGLDLVHLAKPLFEGPWTRLEVKREVPHESFQAYRILERNFREKGPGLVFTELSLLSQGHMLSVAAYHFNASLNPALDPEKARWAGILVNLHYRPFLEKRFPGSQWTSVTSGPAEDGGWVLGILPVGDGDRDLFRRWRKAQDHFHLLGLEAENILNSRKAYQAALERLPEGYPLMAGDPYLASLFGEWLAQYHYGPGFSRNVEVLERALKEGYPAANLYFKLGNFLLMDGRTGEARKAYRAALACREDRTLAGEVLKRLGRSAPEAPKRPPPAGPADR